MPCDVGEAHGGNVPCDVGEAHGGNGSSDSCGGECVGNSHF